MLTTLGILSAAGNGQFATLDPIRHNSLITISGGNLTGTGTSGVGIATVGKNTGKWYWETTINSISSSTADYGKVGITNVFMINPYNTPVSLGGGGSSVGTVGYRGFSMALQARTNFGSSAIVAGNNVIMTAGSIVSSVLDASGNSVSFYVDGQLGCTITLSPGGSTWYPAFQALTGSPASSVTFNFGQNTWSATTAALRTSLLSSGYTIGLY